MILVIKIAFLWVKPTQKTYSFRNFKGLNINRNTSRADRNTGVHLLCSDGRSRLCPCPSHHCLQCLLHRPFSVTRNCLQPLRIQGLETNHSSDFTKLFSDRPRVPWQNQPSVRKRQSDSDCKYIYNTTFHFLITLLAPWLRFSLILSSQNHHV